MNKQEYLDKRNALYDKAKKLIAENKLAEAKEITQQIDKLDSDFENSAVGKANKKRRGGNQNACTIRESQGKHRPYR